MKKATLDWVQTLENAYPELFQTPLWQTPSKLSWELLEKVLQKVLQKQAKLQVIAPLSAESVKFAKLAFSQESVSLAIKLGNIPAACELVFHRQDLNLLLQESLFETISAKTSMAMENVILEGYLLFVATKAASLLNEQGFAWGQMLHISPTNMQEDEPALFQDMELKTDKHTFSLRLIMPVSFVNALKHKFPADKEQILHSEKAKRIPLPLVVQCGRVSLSAKEIKALQVGDAVILDTLSYDPATNRGLFDLQLQNQVIFHAKQKDDSLKLLGYGSHSTQEPLMNDFPSDDEDDFNEDDIEFTDEEENFMAHAADNFETQQEEKPVHPALVNPSETALPVVVEVARLEINLDKLLELAPGNLLDLAVHPEQGVYLTVNNKRVARGELIRVGEALCVRILETAN